MSSELQALQAHLAGGRYQSGVARGRWRTIDLAWPLAYIEVFDRNGRATCIRFDCSGYPASAPQGTPWDAAARQQLPAHLWPRGGRVSKVFNPGWQGGAALYIPCDRVSIAGHENWRTELPHLIWSPARGLMQYLEAIHELLQSNELEPA